ncbi:hypothetical protein JCM10207_008264, partial [Rhodosporidiobolus poonsookiae]
WIDLAAELAPSGVHVYEVDCDAKENKAMCRKAGVQAYPTLKFFNHGASAEYMGKRDVKAMEQFALKAISATTIKPLATSSDLDLALATDDVVVLFLHPSSAAGESISLAHTAAKSLLSAQATFYASSAPSIFSALSLPTDSAPRFVVFKSGSSAPADTWVVPFVADGDKGKHKALYASVLAQTQAWLRTARLPLAFELSGATYADAFPSSAEVAAAHKAGAGDPPLVGVAVLSRAGLGAGYEEAVREVEALATGWGERRRMAGEGQGRDVLWTWVDGDRWKGWARSMFDVKMGAREGPRVVISDPKDLSYYPLALDTQQPLDLSSPTAVFELIEQGVYTGKAVRRSSKGRVERWSEATVHRLSSLYHLSTSHPFLALALVATSWYLIWKGLRRAFKPEPSTGNVYHNGGIARAPKRE